MASNYTPTGVENWLPAHNLAVSASIGPSDSAVDLPVTSAEVARETESFDCTTSEYDTHGISSTATRIRFTTPVDGDDPIVVPDRTLLTMSWEDDAAGAQSGYGRVLSKRRRGGGKGGLFYEYDCLITGPIT